MRRGMLTPLVKRMRAIEAPVASARQSISDRPSSDFGRHSMGSARGRSSAIPGLDGIYDIDISFMSHWTLACLTGHSR